jgi:hypothetical protein
MMNFIHIVLNELTCPYCRLIIRIKAGFVELRREGGISVPRRIRDSRDFECLQKLVEVSRLIMSRLAKVRISGLTVSDLNKKVYRLTISGLRKK